MKSYKLKIKTLLTLSGFLSIVIFAAILLIGGLAEQHTIGELLLHYGYIILPVTAMWWLLENYCWHWKIVQKFRSSLNIPPDFRGRWEGHLDRDGEEAPHSFVIEIKQTLSHIWIFTYSHRSSSQSYISEISTDESESNFTLCYLWQADSGEITHRNIPKSIFKGYSMLRLFEHEKPKRLSGSYFTNREPQTKGVIDLKWIGLNLKSKF